VGQDTVSGGGRVTKAVGGEWRRWAVRGAILWVVSAALLALFARGTAIIPVVEPLHSQFEAQANAIALRIFGVMATPGFLALLLIRALEEAK
jgi:hypothetical protein